MKNKQNSCTLKNVSFKFRKNSEYFFKNICLELEPGRHYFVCGKNGIGKSTFFRILQGHFEPHEQYTGTIILHGSEIVLEHDQSYGSHVRLLTQDVNIMLADKLTVLENLQCALVPHYPTLQKLPHTTVSPMLMACGIKPDQLAVSLSGGQRQMLAIAMALQKPTNVLLLDEPTAALDSNNARIVMEFIQNVARERNIVVLIISHDTEMVHEYAQEQGRIVIEENNGERLVTLRN